MTVHFPLNFLQIERTKVFTSDGRTPKAPRKAMEPGHMNRRKLWAEDFQMSKSICIGSSVADALYPRVVHSVNPTMRVNSTLVDVEDILKPR